MNSNNGKLRECLNAENADVTKDWTETDWDVLSAVLFLSSNFGLLEELRKLIEKRQC